MSTEEPAREETGDPVVARESGTAGGSGTQDVAQPPVDPAAAGAERESVGGVFAVALGLLLIAVSVLPFFQVQLQEVDGHALLSERFASHRIPAGMGVVDALRMGGGKEVVILSDPEQWASKREAEAEVWDAIAERRKNAWGEGFGKGFGGGPPRGGGPGGGRRSGRGSGGHGGGMPSFGGGGFPKTDWKDVAEGPAGQAPWELAFAWYPREAGEELLRQQFGQRGFGDLRFVGPEGGKVTIDQGPVSWAGYDTHFVVEREFGKVDGKKVFRDSLRINLSLGNRACVLYARWEQGAPGSVEAVREVLSGFDPIDPIDSA